MDGWMDRWWTGKHFSIEFQFPELTAVVSSVSIYTNYLLTIH
jgi:hypothetical protein